ncbi:MAG: FtsQ-type POTRA domain-containing protein [Cyanobacteria bacterium P01_H01_bin.162]
MTELVTPSPEELSYRRRTLKKQRRTRNLQHIWRVFAIGGLAVGAFWLMRNPFWLLLQSNDQVILSGNDMLDEAAIYELLALEYPQPLFEIEPEVIVQRLSTQSPIADAQVDRQLFPPRLEITLQERQPVAVTVPLQPLADANAELTPTNHAGFLDAQGYWMPQNFVSVNREFDAPQLRVRGFHSRYHSQWPQLYQTLQTSEIAITEVDWRSPSNLIVQTELGQVHLGVFSPQRLKTQLAMLPRFRSLTDQANLPAVDYIDLVRPETPAVKLVNPAAPAPDSP